jgi:hypothetical protein
MVEPACEQLHHWKLTGKQVKYTRLDNAGENKKLKTRSDSADWKLNIDYEFTSRDTYIKPSCGAGIHNYCELRKGSDASRKTSR